MSALLIALAWNAHGLAYPSFLVDPWCRHSTVRLPTWEMAAIPAGAKVLAIGSVRLPDQDCATALYAEANRALTSGMSSVQIELKPSGDDRSQTHQVALRRISSEDVGFFFGLYLVSGWLVLLSGVLLRRLAGTRPAARAYVFWSYGAFLFLASLFEFHTTARVTALFSVATGWVPAGWLALAYAFPSPPRTSKALRRLSLAAAGGVLSFGVLVPLANTVGLNAAVLQRALPLIAAVALCVLAGSVFLRLRFATGRERTELTVAAWGFGIAPVAGALLIVAATWGDAAFHLALPFLVIALPGALAWALVRHNILRSVEVLTSRMLLAPLLLASALVAGVVGLVLRMSLQSPLAPALVASAVCFSLFALMGRAMLRRLLFPSALRFRPSVQRLGDSLVALREYPAIRAELEAAARSAVGVTEARVFAARELKDAGTTAEMVEALARGERRWDDEAEPRLWIPLRSLSELRGAIRLGPKQSRALFTSEDLELMETLAAVGALALHNAEVVAEIDARRRLQMDASRVEKRLALGVVGAEISHEISYPLNFFRHLLRRSDSGGRIDGEDLEIAREEVDRLDRMVASLRKLAASAGEGGTASLAESVHRALRIIQPDTEAAAVRVELEVEDVQLPVSPDALLQLLANLLRNAVQAAGNAGQVGVRTRRVREGWTVEVWDSGPGVPPEIEPLLFDPWVTARAGGTGLGLSISQRIARSFGWSLAYTRQDGRTVFRLSVPVAGTQPAQEAS